MLEFVLLPEPDACGFWVKVVTNDVTSVVVWLFCPSPVEVDKIVVVTTTGLGLGLGFDPLPVEVLFEFDD